jgi:hypothetical protein
MQLYAILCAFMQIKLHSKSIEKRIVYLITLLSLLKIN